MQKNKEEHQNSNETYNLSENKGIIITSLRMIFSILLSMALVGMAFIYASIKFPAFDFLGLTPFFEDNDNIVQKVDKGSSHYTEQNQVSGINDDDDDDSVDFNEITTVKETTKNSKPDFREVFALSNRQPGNVSGENRLKAVSNSSAINQQNIPNAVSAKTKKFSSETKITQYAKRKKNSRTSKASKNHLKSTPLSTAESQKIHRETKYAAARSNYSNAARGNKRQKPLPGKYGNTTSNFYSANNAKSTNSGTFARQPSGHTAMEQAKRINTLMADAASGNEQHARGKSDSAWSGSGRKDGQLSHNSKFALIGGNTPSTTENEPAESSFDSPKESENVTPWESEIKAIKAVFSSVLILWALAAIFFDATSLASVVAANVFCSLAIAASTTLTVLGGILMIKYKQYALGGIWAAIGTACLTVSITALTIGIRQGHAIRKNAGVVSEQAASALHTLIKFMGVSGVGGGVVDAYADNINEKAEDTSNLKKNNNKKS